jgi:hypothetical protein
VVEVFYLTHKLSDVFKRMSIEKGIKFLMNPKKQGKKKYMRKRYFKNLRSSLYYAGN